MEAKETEPLSKKSAKELRSFAEKYKLAINTKKYDCRKAKEKQRLADLIAKEYKVKKSTQTTPISTQIKPKKYFSAQDTGYTYNPDKQTVTVLGKEYPVKAGPKIQERIDRFFKEEAHLY